MNLLLLTEEQYPFNLGGGTTYLKTFQKGLDYFSKKYEIICPRYYPDQSKIDVSNVTFLGINLRKYSSFYIRTIFKLYYYLIWYSQIMFYLLTKNKIKKFDILIAQEIIFSGLIILLLGRLFRKPTVLIIHGNFVEGLKDRNLPKIIIKLAYLIERFVASKMKLLICVSRNIKDYYSEYNKNSIFLPNFIETLNYKKRNPKNLKVIAYIGRLSKEKNIDIIINAASLLKDKTFLIIGDGPEKEYLTKLKKELSATNVFFLGRREDIPSLHQQIDLVVYLWQNESFGLSALEAMSSGIPVIAADTNEMHHFVGKAKSGIVISKDKINKFELVKSIKRMENKRKYSFYANNAYKTAKKYDYRNLILKYIHVFNKLKNISAK